MITTRRDFLQFLGKAVPGSFALAAAIPGISMSRLSYLSEKKIKGMVPTDKDDLVLADGLSYETLIRWNEKINADRRFGFNCDFTCFIPGENENEGLLWVNHEYLNPLFVSAHLAVNGEKTQASVDEEMASLGGSIIKIERKKREWRVSKDQSSNRRVDAKTKIPFNWDKKIYGSSVATGTHSNCSGGITPWGTILTCEENYNTCVGEVSFEDGQRKFRKSWYGWERFYDLPPEHYGWVVEVNPRDGLAQKHVALGRFAHECCTLQELEDGRIVAYSGDDANDEFIYKFISSKRHSLREGTLYVANTEEGKWISLDYASQPLLKEKFNDQTEVLIRVREAACMLGATPQNRPEDIEIDPLTGNVIIALTNNKPKGDYHGSLLKIEETEGYDGLAFKSATFLAGGEETGFSCPDNMVFDKVGNLWFTSDISGSAMNKEGNPYFPFKNNGLFVLLRHGSDAGKVIQLASAPREAELTGPWFSPDYQTLFLSVQHPGESSKSFDALTSNWPHDKDGIPKPSVVTVQGDLLDKIVNLNVTG